MTKIKGIKKACQEINASRNLYCRVMFDAADSTVWVDAFPDSNDWNEYHSRSITNVGNVPQGVWDNYRHIPMAEIREMVARAV